MIKIDRGFEASRGLFFKGEGNQKPCCENCFVKSQFDHKNKRMQKWKISEIRKWHDLFASDFFGGCTYWKTFWNRWIRRRLLMIELWLCRLIRLLILERSLKLRRRDFQLIKKGLWKEICILSSIFIFRVLFHMKKKWFWTKFFKLELFLLNWNFWMVNFG